MLTLGNEPLPALFPEGPRRLVSEGYGEPAQRRLLERHEVTAIRFDSGRQTPVAPKGVHPDGLAEASREGLLIVEEPFAVPPAPPA